MTRVGAGTIEAGAPRGVHLSFTGDPATTQTVVWFTDGTTDPGSSVEFGPADLGGCTGVAFTRAATGTTQEAPGLPVLVHEATLTELEPDTTVCYRVGGSSGFSPARSFRTAEHDGPFRFTAFGDHGTGPQSRSSTAAILEAAPDFHLIAGDISYANGLQPVWDTYFDELEPLASRIPVMAALGNHEVEDGFGTSAFRARMAHPGAELYYSFDYANVHVLIVDGGAALEEAILPAELAFIEHDLSVAVARRAAGEIDFIVVMQHFPLYSNHDTRGPCDAALVAVEEQILQRYQVDVLIQGHNHHFERSKPMAYGQPTTEETRDFVDPAGYVSVITGGGGKSLYDFAPPEAIQTWSVAYAKRFHYTEFSVDGDTMTVRAVTTDAPAGEVLDTFTLRARGASPAVPPAPLTPNACP